MGSRVIWYPAVVRKFTIDGPQKAFDLAAKSSARIAASKAGGGSLSKELANPKRVGFLHSRIQSSKPYAPIQNWGGTIRPRRPGGRLLIGANRGKITASADRVTIRGKHFLEPASAAFAGLYISNLARILPG